MAISTLTDKVGIQLATRITLQGLQFVDGIILVRFLSASDFATYAQVWLVFSLISPFLGGLGGGSGYYLPRLQPGMQKGYLAQSIVVGSVCGILTCLAMWLGADFVSVRFKNPELLRLLHLFCLFPILSFPCYFFGQFAVCVNRNLAGALVAASGKVVNSIIILACLLLGASLHTLFMSLLVYQAIMMVVMIGYTSRFYRKVRLQWDWSLLRGHLSFVVPLALATSVELINGELGKLIASSYLLPTVVAIYLIGAREIPVLSVLGGSIADILLPRMSQEHASGNLERVREIWSESMRKQAMFVIPAFVFLMAFAPEFIVTLYGSRYVDSAAILRVYLLAMPVRCVLWSLVLSAAGQTRPVFGAIVVAMFLNIGVSIILIRYIGLLGPAFGTVASIFVSSGILAFFTYRRLGVNVMRCFPWGFAARLASISLPTCAVALAAKFLPVRVEIHFMTAAIFFAAIMLTVFVKGGILTQYEKASVMRLVKLQALLGSGKTADPR